MDQTSRKLRIFTAVGLILLLCGNWVQPAQSAAVVAAFPGATGGGATSVGGRGGVVKQVTTLADSGPGSLRECVSAYGPRTCVFRVSGTIELRSTLWVTNPYLTIAGQTAPGGGVLLRGNTMPVGQRASMIIKTHDVTVRYLRFLFGERPSNGGDEGVNLEIWGDPGQQVNRIMLDHLSIGWSIDDNFGVWSQGAAINSVTLANSIVGQSLMAATNSYGKGAIIGSHVEAGRQGMQAIDLHDNFLTSNAARMPYVGGASTVIANNVIYNWGAEMAVGMRGGTTVDVIGNVVKPGPNSEHGAPNADFSFYEWDSASCERDRYCIRGNPSILMELNVAFPEDVRAPAAADNWRYLQGWNPTRQVYQTPTSYRRTTALSELAPLAFPLRISNPDTVDLEAEVLAGAGANARLTCNGSWVSNRDAVFQRMINAYWSDTGRIPATADDAGGFPQLATGSACADADSDGMPDVWEKANGLDPSDAADGSVDAGSGYTNLELYLAGA